MAIGEKIGPFLLEAELGSGAMGIVYRARYEKTGKLVALKVISYTLVSNETAFRRFKLEGDILKTLKHPHIVRWYATGNWHPPGASQKLPFFAMEYVQGDSLDKILEERQQLHWTDVVALGTQLCDALQHAHEKGIIHRDLKPSNLMILPDNTLKLTDFGIAKDPNVTALTGTHSTIGTAAYMSPEQCKGDKSISGKSDLYSMGVVFYELLTGRKPFQAESTVDMFMMHVKGKFERPSRLVPDIPMWLDTLVCQLLEKKPEHRPLDAAMVKSALEEVRLKMDEGHSVGAELAGARVVDKDKLGLADLNETDKEAARTLRAGLKKKKKKPKPINQQAWFQWGLIPLLILGLLGGLGFLLREALKPDSPTQMIAQVNERVDAIDDNPSSYIRALEAVDGYLKVYGDRDDEDTRRMHSLKARLQVNKFELQIHKRYNSPLGQKPDDHHDPKAYELTFAAIKAEELGEIKDAREKWKSIAKDHPGDEWGDLARKKLDVIESITLAERRIRDRLWDQPDYESDTQRYLAEALQLEEFDDKRRALDRWKKVKEATEKDLVTRVEFLMAAERVRSLQAELGGEESQAEIDRRRTALRTIVEKTIPEYLQGNAEDQQRGRAVAAFLSTVYADDPDREVAQLATQAGDLLK